MSNLGREFRQEPIIVKEEDVAREFVLASCSFTLSRDFFIAHLEFGEQRDVKLDVERERAKELIERKAKGEL